MPPRRRRLIVRFRDPSLPADALQPPIGTIASRTRARIRQATLYNTAPADVPIQLEFPRRRRIRRPPVIEEPPVVEEDVQFEEHEVLGNERDDESLDLKLPQIRLEKCIGPRSKFFMRNYMQTVQNLAGGEFQGERHEQHFEVYSELAQQTFPIFCSGQDQAESSTSSGVPEMMKLYDWSKTLCWSQITLLHAARKLQKEELSQYEILQEACHLLVLGNIINPRIYTLSMKSLGHVVWMFVHSNLFRYSTTRIHKEFPPRSRRRPIQTFWKVTALSVVINTNRVQPFQTSSHHPNNQARRVEYMNADPLSGETSTHISACLLRCLIELLLLPWPASERFDENNPPLSNAFGIPREDFGSGWVHLASVEASKGGRQHLHAKIIVCYKGTALDTNYFQETVRNIGWVLFAQRWHVYCHLPQINNNISSDPARSIFDKLYSKKETIVSFQQAKFVILGNDRRAVMMTRPDCLITPLHYRWLWQTFTLLYSQSTSTSVLWDYLQQPNFRFSRKMQSKLTLCSMPPPQDVRPSLVEHIKTESQSLFQRITGKTHIDFIQACQTMYFLRGREPRETSRERAQWAAQLTTSFLNVQ